MTRIQIIAAKDLNQFIASRKMGGKIIEQFESTDDERRNKKSNRRAEKNDAITRVNFGFPVSGQESRYRNAIMGGGDGNERNEPDESIEHYRQQRAGFLVRRFLLAGNNS